MTDLGGFRDHVARVDLSDGEVAYEGVDDEDAKKYIGARGLGVKYVFDQGPDVDPLGPDNLLAFMNGPLTGTQVTMSGRISICTKSPIEGQVTDSHHGGWSGARLKWAGFDGLLFEGEADDPVYAYVEDGEVELRDASHLWGQGVHATMDDIESDLDGEYGKNLSAMAVGPAGENEVRYACIVNEDDRASGRGGTGAVMGSKNLKAVVVKSSTKMQKPADQETFREGHKQAMQLIQESDVTAPNEGGLSMYGTNVLMNVTEEMDGLPTKNGQYSSTRSMNDSEGVDIDAELVSGEHVRENILADEPTCHSCPVACKKEVEVQAMHKGDEMNVQMESFEYESAWALGPNSGHTDLDDSVLMVDRCNDLGIDTIAIHKAVPFGPIPRDAFHPGDVDEAAASFPDIDFSIVHGGIAFAEETAWQLARFPNVYVNLDQMGWILVVNERAFAERLATLLRVGGEDIIDRLMWGSGAVAFHPQPQLEAFRRFEFPEDVRQQGDLWWDDELPRLTDEHKRKILGGNFCEAHGFDESELRSIEDDYVKPRDLADPFSTTNFEVVAE